MNLAIYGTVMVAMVVATWGQQLSSKECENLGFTGLALCSDCKSFSDFVKDQAAEQNSNPPQAYYAAADQPLLHHLHRPLLHHLLVAMKDQTQVVLLQHESLLLCFLNLILTFQIMLLLRFLINIRICYLHFQDLIDDCLKCCVEDSDDSMSKVTYSGVLLEVCMRKLVFYPEIVGFIEEEKDKFPSVKVQYSFNSPPKLVMLDDDGKHAETIRIDNWKREHILQFLRGKLKPGSAAS